MRDIVIALTENMWQGILIIILRFTKLKITILTGPDFLFAATVKSGQKRRS